MQFMLTYEEEIEEVVGWLIESTEESEYISSCYIISNETRYSWVGVDADSSHVHCELRCWADMQQSRRAGRDGAPSNATVIQGAVYAPNGKRRAGGRFRDMEVEVHEIIEGDGCIRVVLDREVYGDAAK
jgi:hypothetical protein